MKFLNVILLILVSFNFFSQESEKRKIYEIEIDENGNESRIWIGYEESYDFDSINVNPEDYMNGGSNKTFNVITFLSVYYDTNMRMINRSYYKDDKLVLFQNFHSNGKLKSEKMIYDFPNSFREDYGNLDLESSDFKNGIERRYNNDGQLEFDFIYYHGKTITERRFKNGRLNREIFYIVDLSKFDISDDKKILYENCYDKKGKKIVCKN